MFCFCNFDVIIWATLFEICRSSLLLLLHHSIACIARNPDIGNLLKTKEHFLHKWFSIPIKSALSRIYVRFLFGAAVVSWHWIGEPSIILINCAHIHVQIPFLWPDFTFLLLLCLFLCLSVSVVLTLARPLLRFSDHHAFYRLFSRLQFVTKQLNLDDFANRRLYAKWQFRWWNANGKIMQPKLNVFSMSSHNYKLYWSGQMAQVWNLTAPKCVHLMPINTHL